MSSTNRAFRMKQMQSPRLFSDHPLKTLPDERTTTVFNQSRKMESQSSYDNAIENRLYHIEQLAESLKSNTSIEQTRIMSSLQEIAKTLKSISKTEIELNQKNKQLDHVTMESVMQKQTIQKLKDQQNHYKVDNEGYLKQLSLSQQDQHKLCRDLLQQKKVVEEQYKKIKFLEKRIEMMLEKNLYSHSEELRNTLSELIRDNEQLKRDLVKKEKENERLKDLNSKLLQQNNRLTKKLDSLKTKKVGVKENITENQQISNYAFNPNSLPSNLEFRLNDLDNDDCDFLLDLIEHGPEVFTNQVVTLDSIQQKKDLINLVASQFISARDFSEKINQIMNEFITMISYKSIQDFQIHISKAFRSIFGTEIVHLWIIDGMTCRAQTYDSNGVQHVALLTDGVFSQLVFEDYGIRSPSKKQELLYITENNEVFGKNFLLLPIMGNSFKPCGILEIQNIQENLFLDSQYYGLLINMLSKSVVQSILDFEALVKELNYRDLFYRCFNRLIQCKDKEHFCTALQESAMQIFQIAQTKLLFIENNQFWIQGRIYQLQAGCAYQIYLKGKPQIFTQITRQDHFDENTDISSILPVFIAPIYLNEQITAILQFILKKKQMIDKHPFGNQANIGFRLDTIDQDAQKFYEIVQNAFQIVFR
ncbi:unnamed protein product [Paramecium primaurelia]|uniref:GAF domain-containing protein n=1 Tax=Paramecium primaurelia TaxID=5886 RepID=A0A8S1MQR9_PARPR|nr:unnamed protein product [Paramecium primaurelia]